MAWVIEKWSHAQVIESNPNLVNVAWTCEEDTIPGAKKSGAFEHTLDDAKSWADNKTDIETKILNEEGMDQ